MVENKCRLWKMVETWSPKGFWDETQLTSKNRRLAIVLRLMIDMEVMILNDVDNHENNVEKH